MKKILFPIEYSINLQNNFLYALAWAKEFNATLVLMHALGLPPTSRGDKEEWNKKGMEAMDKMMNYVEEHLPRNFQTVNIEYNIQRGGPTAAIQLVIIEEQIDLVVIGMRTPGAPPITDYFSSVAMEVISQVEIPVLILKQEYIFKPEAKLKYIS